MKHNRLVRRLGALALALVLLFSLAACSSERSLRKKATLVVNGTTIDNAQAYLYGEYPFIPLLETLAACGYEINRESNDLAYVTIDHTVYTVNLKDLTMTAQGSEVNLLASPAGESDTLCKRSGKDILVFCYRLQYNFKSHTNIQLEYSANLNTGMIYVDIGVLTNI